MDNLEKRYYEASQFWSDGVLDDKENKERIEVTIGIIPPDVQSLLDAGCGNGVFLNTLLKSRPAIQGRGFDRSEEALKYVNVPKSIGDVTDIQFGDQQFDCVSCLEVIEHIPLTTYKKALSELARVSKKYLLISVPYNEDLMDDSTQCPSCKSVFNANLHLRSYNERNFIHSFDEFGFECSKHVLAGPKRIYRFHKEYKKLFYPTQFKNWRSPLCPICGYQAENSPIRSMNTNTQPVHSSFKSVITGIPKMIWPKETKYYWIIGLFERKN